jgi:hypothetical protein
MERVPILRLGDAVLVWAQVDLWADSAVVVLVDQTTLMTVASELGHDIATYGGFGVRW